MFRRSDYLWWAILPGIVMLALGSQGRAQPSQYDPLFQAMLKSKHRSIDVEFREGVFTAYETYQEIEGFPIGNRHDMIPSGQPAFMRLLEMEPTPLDVTVANADFESLINACVARDDFAELAIYPPADEATNRFISVSLDRPSPLVFRAGSFEMELSPQIFRRFSVNAKFTRKVPDATRLAIVVHEPHWSRLGQFQMIEALREMLPEPLDQPVVFLVEGDYWGGSREIALSPWRDVIGQGPQHEVAIRQLVYDYAIDGVFATRLLRTQDDIPSYAIDDQDLLDRTPRSPDQRELIKSIETLGFSELERQMWASAVLAVGSLRDVQRYDQLLEGIGQSMRTANDQQKEFFASLKDLISTYKLAALRDVSMVQEIDRRMQEHPDAIPFIFIGNFHTEGILDRLRKRQPATQFVVLDTRGMVEEAGDPEAFQDALVGSNDSRRSRKLSVAPHPSRQGEIGRRVTEVRLASSGAARRFEDDAELRGVARRYPVLGSLRIRAGGRTPTPPAPPRPFDRAFASFGPDAQTPGGNLDVYDRQSTGWRDAAARWKVIDLLVRTPPPLDKVVRRVEKQTIDGKEFMIFGDPETKRYYIMERASAGKTLEEDAILKEEPNEADGRMNYLTEKNREPSRQRAA